MLARPLDWRIAQSGDADAAGKPTFDGGLHKIGREEGERDCHVDLAYAAPLALRDAFDAGFCIIDKLVEPTASPGDRRDQGGARFRADRTSVLGAMASGRRISRRRVDGVLCHGTWRVLTALALAAWIVCGWASWMTNCSGWTSTRATWVPTRLRSSIGADGLRCVPNRSYNQCLDLGCRHSADRSGALGLALEQGGREIVAILDAPLAGMARASSGCRGHRRCVRPTTPQISSSRPCDR